MPMGKVAYAGEAQGAGLGYQIDYDKVITTAMHFREVDEHTQTLARADVGGWHARHRAEVGFCSEDVIDGFASSNQLCLRAIN